MMDMFEMVVMLVFIVPIVGLCIGFVVCAGMMQMRETEDTKSMAAQVSGEHDLMTVQRYRAYAAQVSNRRYVRPAGAMIRAAQ